MKAAKLVTFSFTHRVIIDSDASDDEIIIKACSEHRAMCNSNSIGDNIDSIEDDEECPFGTFDHDEIS